THPVRTCAYAEATACRIYGKERAEVLKWMCDSFRSEGFPEMAGLYATGLLIRTHNDPSVIRAMNLWADLVSSYSARDQISLPFVLWKTGLDVDPLPGALGANPYVRWRPHRQAGYYDSRGILRKPLVSRFWHL